MTNKLTVATPPRELVDAYLGEIAKGYGVDWAPPPGISKDTDQDDGGEGGEKVRDSFSRHFDLSAIPLTSC